MISLEDAENTYEFTDHFRILPSSKEKKFKSSIKNRKVKSTFSYSSKDNKFWMSHQKLKYWLKQNPDY